jgi:hypothetical protein
MDVLASRNVVNKQLREVARPLEHQQKKVNLRQTELENQLLRAFEQAGINGICLKGAALARWLYRSPDLRYRTDLDLLVARDRVEEALTLLGELEFGPPLWTVWSTQASLRHPKTGLIVDLHWQLSDHPVFHHAFSFSELWDRSIPLADQHAHIRRLEAPYALVHAVIHRQVEIGGDQARDSGLLDAVLLTEGMDHEQLGRFEVICLEKGLSGLAAAVLQEASEKLDLHKSELIGRLRRRGESEWLTALVNQPRTRFRMAAMAWRAQPGWRERLTLLRRLTFPDPRYLQSRHGEEGSASLVRRYALRILPARRGTRNQ